MNVIAELEKSLPNFERLFEDDILRHFAACAYEDLSACFPNIAEMIRNILLVPETELYRGLNAMGFGTAKDMTEFIIKYFYVKKRADYGLPFQG